MKFNKFVVISLLSFVSGSLARFSNRFRAHAEDDPLEQKSRVTAFVNTDEGLKVECWEIGDFIPKDEVIRTDGTVRQTRLAGNIQITLFSYSPSVTIFSFGMEGTQSSGVDFRARPNLFTVKDGLVSVEAVTDSEDDVGLRKTGTASYTFADVNGDDWFYFEDTTSKSSHETCAKTSAKAHIDVRTVSGSDTTLINFRYESTPRHKVLHEGRCNFAGLQPAGQSDPDSPSFRFRSQDL